MCMVEECYGWDVLYFRLVVLWECKVFIVVVMVVLEKEKNGSGCDIGDEMEEDLSEVDNSNVEMGGMGNGNLVSGFEVVFVKLVRKKWNFKEDEYDKDDDFVDDFEMFWEE